MEIIGEWGQYVSGSWETYSLVLGYWYDQDPSAEYSFPRSDFRSLDEPDWWAANQQWLGAFSIPKAIFFESYIFYNSGIWETGATYDWEGEIGHISDSYEYYFSYYDPNTRPHFVNDFVVPEGDAPGWWADASGLLGAYSEAKKAFMESVFAKDYKEWWDKTAPTLTKDDWPDCQPVDRGLQESRKTRV